MYSNSADPVCHPIEVALRRQFAAITEERTWSATLVALIWFTGGSKGSQVSKKTPTSDYTL